MNIQDDIQITVGKSDEDTIENTTLFGKICRLQQHFHNPPKVYPTLANGIEVTAGSGTWNLGSFVEVVPSNTITNNFHINAITIEDIDEDDFDIFELCLYSGALGSENLIGCTRFGLKKFNGDVEDTVISFPKLPFQCSCINANERISAKVASKTGSKSVTFSIRYHEFDATKAFPM